MKTSTKIALGTIATTVALAGGGAKYYQYFHEKSKKEQRIAQIKQDAEQKKKDNALLDAASQYKVDDMTKALKNGANVNAVDKDGYSSLMLILDHPPVESLPYRGAMIDCLQTLMNQPDIKVNIEAFDGTTAISHLNDVINDYKELIKIGQENKTIYKNNKEIMDELNELDKMDEHDRIYGLSGGLKLLEGYQKSMFQKSEKEMQKNEVNSNTTVSWNKAKDLAYTNAVKKAIAERQ